jgi:hypothetical protein
MGADRKLRKVKVRGGSVLGNDWETMMRVRIQKSAVVNRLISFVNGEVALEPAQVTAAVALMKKVLPDLSYTETKATITHNVIRSPAIAETEQQWLEHVPIEHRTEQ